MLSEWSSRKQGSEPPRPATAAALAAMAQTMITVPDQLAAVHLDLRQLCNGNVSALSVEATRAIADACRRSHAAIADVSGMAQYLNVWMAANGGARIALAEELPEPGSAHSR